mgnify:CR=1 FL=1
MPRGSQLRDGSSAISVTTDGSDLRAAADRSAKRMARNVARELERRRQCNPMRVGDSPSRNEESVEEID